MLYVLPGFTLLVGGFMPAMLQLSFLAGTGIGVLQGQILRNNAIRARLGIAPIVAPPTPNTVEVKKYTVYQAPDARGRTTASADTKADNKPKGFMSAQIEEVKKGVNSVVDEGKAQMRRYLGGKEETETQRRAREYEENFQKSKKAEQRGIGRRKR